MQSRRSGEYALEPKQVRALPLRIRNATGGRSELWARERQERVTLSSKTPVPKHGHSLPRNLALSPYRTVP
jgi:hypothetical protein